MADRDASLDETRGVAVIVVSVFHVPRRAWRGLPEAVTRRVFGVAKVMSWREGGGLRYGMVESSCLTVDLVVVGKRGHGVACVKGTGSGEGMTFAFTISTIRTSPCET